MPTNARVSPLDGAEEHGRLRFSGDAGALIFLSLHQVHHAAAREVALRPEHGLEVVEAARCHAPAFLVILRRRSCRYQCRLGEVLTVRGLSPIRGDHLLLIQHGAILRVNRTIILGRMRQNSTTYS